VEFARYREKMYGNNNIYIQFVFVIDFSKYCVPLSFISLVLCVILCLLYLHRLIVMSRMTVPLYWKYVLSNLLDVVTRYRRYLYSATKSSVFLTSAYRLFELDQHGYHAEFIKTDNVNLVYFIKVSVMTVY
jgi:hypothetical protein